MGGINQELGSLDSHVKLPHSFQFGFDDIGEIQRLKDDAQSNYNQSIGTPVEPVAREVLKAVSRIAPDIVSELVGLSENAEQMTFYD